MMIYFYLYIIPCILNALYLCIPAVRKELIFLSKKINNEASEIVELNTIVKILVTYEIILSWATLFKAICREINIMLFKFYTRQHYTKARVMYVKYRWMEYKAKNKSH